MKKLLPFELMLLFLATTFIGDNSPGWFQQSLPRSDIIVQDIYFLDSLNGWAAAMKYPSQDTGFVFKTTNGGTNWFTIWQQKAFYFALQFINSNTGYIAGSSGSGTGRIYKTTNSGTNWGQQYDFGGQRAHIYFINKNYGISAGATNYRTTNGGFNWIN